MNESVIGIIFDFDETLGPDTISFFLSSQNISPTSFWKEVAALVKDSWDPPLAYMHVLLEYSREGKLDLSQKTLQKAGRELPLFPGLPKACTELKEFVRDEPRLKAAGVKIELYIISGGLEEVIRGSKVSEAMDGIFGSNFAYEKGSVQPIAIKSAVSFTEKTRYLFGINKGISVKEIRTNPYRINDALPKKARRIPFERMIYIGDGPSDIPSFSTITQYDGAGIGVSAPTKTFKKGYELARGKRITVGPYTADYRKGTDMRKVLEETILRIGLEIGLDKKRHVVKAPSLG
jgi:phosphoglycolate phosphatase-like HAD superfamily hydrolase